VFPLHFLSSTPSPKVSSLLLSIPQAAGGSRSRTGSAGAAVAIEDAACYGAAGALVAALHGHSGRIAGRELGFGEGKASGIFPTTAAIRGSRPAEVALSGYPYRVSAG
jgi:hypothetical protein